MIDQYTTLTGLVIAKAFEKLDDEFPAQAYTAGGSERPYEYTGIDPAYLTSSFSEVFGPYGIGWFFRYADENLESHHLPHNMINKKTGEKYSVMKWTCNIRRLELIYVYCDHNGELHHSEPVIGVGSDTKSDAGDAYKGALTGALKNAASRMGWQISVYKDKRRAGGSAKAGRQTNPQSGTRSDDTGKRSIKDPNAPATAPQTNAISKLIEELKAGASENERVKAADLKYSAEKENLTKGVASTWIETLNALKKELLSGRW